MPSPLPAPAPLAALQPGVAERVAELAAPWQSAYSNSAVLSTAVLFLHLAALVAGGGLALAADRGTWRAWRGEPADRARHLTELGLTHRPVLAALALSFASGVLLFLADVEEYAASPLYWTKMALVACLLVNGFFMTRAEGALRAGAAPRGAGERLWSRLRANAVLSGALWFATLLAGTALTAG